MNIEILEKFSLKKYFFKIEMKFCEKFDKFHRNFGEVKK